ncbi:uncharacterized protein TNCV_5073351 [Trichonephila clavipes]|nr:uncharacterized protein TNCV_5073351 [Trichonephila clavipes]
MSSFLVLCEGETRDRWRVCDGQVGPDVRQGTIAPQVTWTTPELAPPLLTTTPHQREDVSALDRFNVHRSPTRRVFRGTGLELVTRQAMIRYLYHSATVATKEVLDNAASVKYLTEKERQQ